MYNNLKILAVIVAAGNSSRMKTKENKVFYPLAGFPVIYHAIKAFEQANYVDNIIIVTKKDDISRMQNIVEESSFRKVFNIIEGGKSRQNSVKNALIFSEGYDIIVVHDGARALVTDKIICKVICGACENSAAICGVKTVDTIKQTDELLTVKQTLCRDDLWNIQTPQAFERKTLVKAHETNVDATDDSSLVELIGVPVKVVEGSYENIKITTPVDAEIAEVIIKRRQQ